MTNEISVENFIKFYLGIAITGLGIVLVYQANLGSAPMATLSEGVSRTFDITPGNANIILNVGILCGILLLDRSNVGIGTLLSAVSFGALMNFWGYIIGDSLMFSNIGLRLAICLIGIVIEAYGLSYYMRAKLGYGALEIVSEFISKKLNTSFAKAKQATDFTLVVSGVLLGATIGFGTVLSIIFVGYFIDLFLKKGKKNEIN